MLLLTTIIQLSWSFNNIVWCIVFFSFFNFLLSSHAVRTYRTYVDTIEFLWLNESTWWKFSIFSRQLKANTDSLLTMLIVCKLITNTKFLFGDCVYFQNLVCIPRCTINITHLHPAEKCKQGLKNEHNHQRETSYCKYISLDPFINFSTDICFFGLIILGNWMPVYKEAEYRKYTYDLNFQYGIFPRE